MSKHTLSPNEILILKCSQLGFADLKAFKELRNERISKLINECKNDEDLLGFVEELADFNNIIETIIDKKIFEMDRLERN